MNRRAKITRDTFETQIRVALGLDGVGKQTLNTGIPFLDHVLDQIARYGMVDLDVSAAGDTHISDHHTVEDVGITLDQAVAKAIGDKKGVIRYDHNYVPLDEVLSRVIIDFPGRPGLGFHVPFTRACVSNFGVGLSIELFRGLISHAGVTLHIDSLRNVSAHHQIETMFKAFGHALHMVVEIGPRAADTIPSTKSAL